MPPPIGDVLGRSADNAIANWETVALEVAISAALAIGVNLTMLAAVTPLMTSIVRAPRAEVVIPTVIRVVVSLLVSGIVWIIVTAFPIAASARTYIDGERAAAAAPARTREAYRVFSFPAWLAAGAAMWARVLGIEIVVAAIGVLIVGIPMLVLFALPRVAAGCAGILLVFPIAVVTIVMVTLCMRKAVVIAVARGTGVEESLSMAWGDVKRQFAAHFLPALVIGLVTLAASFALGIFGGAMKIVLGPVGPLVPALRALATAPGICWLLAAFVALIEER
ncbi:MAG TPA: hypothetical protein VG323_01485 [Thermoanaerobaculia bacterium]|nr:hypothetical protein [Thermoanaerobaculia bacterium]